MTEVVQLQELRRKRGNIKAKLTRFKQYLTDLNARHKKLS